MVDLGRVSGILGDILKEVPLSAVLKERLLLAQDQLALALDEKGKLEEKLAKALAEIDRLQKEADVEAAAKKVADPFVEEEGAIFKRKPGGGYQNAVYCPGCRLPMSTNLLGHLWCDSCQRKAPFGPGAVAGIIARLSTQG